MINKADEVVHTELVDVSLATVWHGAAGKFDSRIAEIGMESCFIGSVGQEIHGETIQISVRLPSEIWITLQGVVTYSEHPIGFEANFINLNTERRDLITRLVAAHGGKRAQTELDGQRGDIPVDVFNSPRRVLIADDDAMTVEMLRAVIAAQGYEVVFAFDGRAAYDILHEDSAFVAAIFDMAMPYLDGLELIRYARSDKRLQNIPIGIITAERDPKIWDDSLAAGANIFLPKPFSPPQVQMMIRMLDKTVDLPRSAATA